MQAIGTCWPFAILHEGPGVCRKYPVQYPHEVNRTIVQDAGRQEEQVISRLQRVTLRRLLRHVLLMSCDAVLVILALLSSHQLSIEEHAAFTLESSLVYLLLFPLLSVLIIYRLGIYRSVLLYMGLRSLRQLMHSSFLLTLTLAALIYLDKNSPLPYQSIPLFWLLVLVFIGGSRLVINLVLQNLVQNFRPKEVVLIYGAGSTGTQLAAALLTGNHYLPVAFIDDNESIQGDVIHGVRVFSAASIPKLIETWPVRQILLAIPSATNAERKQVLGFLEGFPVHVKTVPDIFSMVSGKLGVEQVRDIEIEDLLQRTVVPPHTNLLSACIRDTSVLVTGAGGSIGSELCRQIIRLMPRQLVLLDISEFGLYSIEEELQEMLKAEASLRHIKLVTILGSVRNHHHMEDVMRQFAVSTVYHAAAYKHLPMVEKNIIQGVYNNIFGTYATASAARNAGVRYFVFVSTDKAVRPTSIMGATKRFAELILQSLAAEGGKTCFSMVRFGNVLGSSGSVVPVFRRQIRKGGPVTVTHPEVTRYFMTVQEAAQLVIQAGAMAKGGDVFVLDMHEPVKILDLARKMIHLMGYMVKDDAHRNGDIEIVFTGLRPGEKLYEELLIGEAVTGTVHPGIMRAEEDFFVWDELKLMLEELESACEQKSEEQVRSILSRAIGGFVTRTSGVDPALAGAGAEPGAERDAGKVTRLFS